MASVELQEKANFTRLSRLLVDKGTEALRITFDAIHPPVNLPAVLKANRTRLLKLRPRVISDTHWDLLFPPSGNPPNSKTFDVTLITILLRNICSLLPPASGWNTMPPNTDYTREANATRIKLLRNQVYAHVTCTQVDQTTFDDIWQELSRALFHMKIPQEEIDALKICPLGPEEEIYKQTLEEWVFKDEECKNMLNDVNKSVHLIKQQMVQLELQRERDREAIKASNQEIKALKEVVEQNRQEIEQLQSSVSKNTLDEHPTHKSIEGGFRENSADSVDKPLVQEVGRNNFESQISNKVNHFNFCTEDLGSYDGDSDEADDDFDRDDCFDDCYDNCDDDIVDNDSGDFDHDDADDIDYNRDLLDYDEADDCDEFDYGDLDRDDADDDYDHDVPDYNEEFECSPDEYDEPDYDYDNDLDEYY